MKTILMTCLMISSMGFSFAQVGIGTVTPDDSSILDIAATDKGVLIPRMTQNQRNLIATPANGLLIYQTDNSPGFYFHNGSSWTSLNSSGANAINDLNDGLSDGSSVYLGNSSGLNDNLGSNDNTGVGRSALAQNTSGQINTAVGSYALNNNQTGFGNVAIGNSSMYTNTGDFNVAIGATSLYSNTNGTSNVALGPSALQNGTTGSRNIGIGGFAGRNNTIGTDNISIGDLALENNINGNSNISIGSNSGSTNVGSGNIFLGSNAGFNETGSNKLYIENSDADSNNALIYGDFDSNILRTNSEFQIGNPSGTGYVLPTTDGTANQILTTDGSGQLTFSTLATPSEDVDWYQEGTTNVPTAITDDMYTQGNVAIGKTTADSPLDIEVSGSPSNLIALKIVDNSTGTGDHIGMQQSLGGTHDESIKGIETYVANTGSGLHTGISTSVQNGTGNQVGNRTIVNGSSGNGTLFSGAVFDSGSASTSTQTGIGLSIQQPSSQISYGAFNTLNASGVNATGTKYGMYNLLDGGSGNHFGVYNDVRGTENNTKYGTYNLFGIGTTDTGGELYGTYNSFGSSITSTNSKYGNYTVIPASLMGSHFGTYADVQNSAGYAGYFIGRMSLGNSLSNRYTMPAADGAAGEVLTAAGDGTTSWSSIGSGGTPSIVNVNTSSVTSIPSTSTYTLIPFDTESIDTNSEFNTTTSQFTATTGGYYRVYVKVTVNFNDFIQIGLFVGGVVTATTYRYFNTSGGGTTVTIDEILYLNPSDTIDIQGLSIFSGTNVTNGATNRDTTLQIRKLN